MANRQKCMLESALKREVAAGQGERRWLDGEEKLSSRSLTYQAKTSLILITNCTLLTCLKNYFQNDQ